MTKSQHILVCPLAEELLSKLSERRVIVDLSHEKDIDDARNLCARFKVHLQMCRVKTERALADVELQPQWEAIRTHLVVGSGMGPFKGVVSRLAPLRRKNLRVDLPPAEPTSYRDATILASLGVAVAVDPTSPGVQWDLLTDLMTYALLGQAPHAPIEPFDYLLKQYLPTTHTDFRSTFLDDAERFLHLDIDGRVALSAADLAAGRFVLDSPDNVDQIAEVPAYREHLGAWRDVFLDFDGCGMCPGWRVCMGRVRGLVDDLSACRAFFVELLDTVEQAQALRARQDRSWLY